MMAAPQLTIMQGDALEKLRDLPSESVQLIITSPPYWGLRDYKVDGQLGLEKTPEEYVHKIVKIFREVRRVLRKDGGMWLNLGDTYAGGAGGYDPKYERPELRDKHSGFIGANGGNYREKREWTNHPILKPKDQCLIPHRVAIALQADGW